MGRAVDLVFDLSCGYALVESETESHELPSDQYSKNLHEIKGCHLYTHILKLLERYPRSRPPTGSWSIHVKNPGRPMPSLVLA
jgi:hypothetical protein